MRQEQLYGKFDLDSGEWTDGVLAILIRDCASLKLQTASGSYSMDL